jgi:hypothetical protein
MIKEILLMGWFILIIVHYLLSKIGRAHAFQTILIYYLSRKKLTKEQIEKQKKYSMDDMIIYEQNKRVNNGKNLGD